MDTVIFAVVTVVAILASLYLYAASQVSMLKKNWPQYRCNPIYMPMAGMVGEDVMSNFTKCTMKGFHDYAGFIMDPIVAEFGIVNETLGEVGSTLVSMRKMMSGVRGGFLSVVGSVFGKIQNVMSQTQYTVIRMRTLMSRVLGVMYSFLYIFYGGVESGKSLVNGPVGQTMNFLCFDENTKIQTFEGFKPIKDVRIGERLMQNFSIITSVYKIDGSGVQMYSLSDIIVSGSHKVKHRGKFIRVDKHPDAKKLDKRSKTLVCLNTNSHRIGIKNYEFLDFIESEDTYFNEFKSNYIQMLYNGKVTTKPNEYHSGILVGTNIPTMYGLRRIETIEPGDILDNGDVVIGVCCHAMKDTMYVEVEPGILTSLGTWVYKDDKIARADTFGKIQYGGISCNLIYQLITHTSMYPVSGTNNRIMILDELQTTDPYFHSIKDSIITTGRFRSKLIVV
jgi:hypothetical protein